MVDSVSRVLPVSIGLAVSIGLVVFAALAVAHDQWQGLRRGDGSGRAIADKDAVPQPRERGNRAGKAIPQQLAGMTNEQA